MTTIEGVEQLAAYTPAPRTRRRNEALFQAARRTFGVFNGPRDAERPLDLRAGFRRLCANEPFSALAAAATFAEVLHERELGRLAHSVLMSVVELCPTDEPRPGQLGTRLVGLADALGRSKSSVRDACRMLIVLAQCIPASDILTELNPLIGENYLPSFDRLAADLDAAILFRLVACWWNGRQTVGLGNSTAVNLLSDFQTSHRARRDWWNQQLIVARSSLLEAATRTMTSAEFFELAESLAIAPHLAPDGACQIFGAAHLWQLLARTPPDRDHQELKWRTVAPPRCFGQLLSQIGRRHTADVDLFSPVSLVTSLWVVHELFGLDQKASIHECMTALFQATPEHCQRTTLPLLFNLLPQFSGLWHTQKLTWAHHLELIQAESGPFHAEIDELFECQNLMQQSSERIAEIVLFAIQGAPEPGCAPAAQLIVPRLQSRKHRERHQHSQPADDLAALQIVEALCGTSEWNNEQLDSQLGQSEIILDLASMGVLADANMIAGNRQRGASVYRAILERAQGGLSWADVYAATMMSMGRQGCLEIAKQQAERLSTSTAWLQDPQCGSLDMRTIVAANCIKLMVADRPDWVEDAAAVLASELAQSFEREGPSDDQFYNLHYTSLIRHLVPRSLSAIALDSRDLHAARRRRAVLWDIEFTHRSLHDQRRFWQPLQVDHTVPRPSENIGMVLGRAAAAEEYSTSTAACPTGALAALSLVTTPLRPALPWKRSPEPPVSQNESHSANIGAKSRFGRLPAEPDVDAALVHSLSESTLLLKLGFSLRGEFVWSAFRTRSGGLQLVGSDSGAGPPHAGDQLKAIVEQFDADYDGIFFRGQIRAQSELAANIDAVSFHLASVDTLASAAGCYRELLLGIEFGWEASRDAQAVLQSLRNRFKQPADWRKGADLPPTCSQWELYWSPDGAKQDLDQATEKLLRHVSALLPLADMAAVIKPDDDVVLMLEDVLFAIPIAYLKLPAADGQVYFFEAVRTMRTVFSPTIHATLLAEESQPLLANANDQVICISGVSGNVTDELVATRRLFESHASSARTHGLIWRGAWDNPRGCHDVMARGLEQVAPRARTALLTILGHGHSEGGIQLRTASSAHGSEFWTAHSVRTPLDEPEALSAAPARSGCELSSVDLLIQVSCSAGRAQQDGLNDLRGFPANLVVAGARSTVAARWPILADQAEQLANHLARDYLDRRAAAIASGTPLRLACVRALALANTRRWVAQQSCQAKTTGHSPAVGLHTAAAFELYGFG